jgi:hypothetical protein
MSGAIHPLPQYAFMAWCSVKTQGQLYLYLTSWVYDRTTADSSSLNNYARLNTWKSKMYTGKDLILVFFAKRSGQWCSFVCRSWRNSHGMVQEGQSRIKLVHCLVLCLFTAFIVMSVNFYPNNHICFVYTSCSPCCVMLYKILLHEL